VNGEAIYRTRPWKVFGEGPTDIPEGAFTDTKRSSFVAGDYRFTCREDSIYVIAMTWPGETAVIGSLAGEPVSQVTAVNGGRELSFDVTDEGLVIHLDCAPTERPYVIRIQLGI